MLDKYYLYGYIYVWMKRCFGVETKEWKEAEN